MNTEPRLLISKVIWVCLEEWDVTSMWDHDLICATVFESWEAADQHNKHWIINASEFHSIEQQSTSIVLS